MAQGQWEKQIIDRIVTQHETSQQSKPNLNRATPGRKSLKDIFRSSIKIDSKLTTQENISQHPKEQNYLNDKIAKAEKEIKKEQ